MKWKGEIRDLSTYPEDVIMEVQIKAGTEPDGILGPRTWGAGGNVRTGSPDLTGTYRHSWSRAPDEGKAGPDPDIFWVRCSGCGATVVTKTDLFPDRCHDGWRMPEDCRETVVQDVMES